MFLHVFFFFAHLFSTSVSRLSVLHPLCLKVFNSRCNMVPNGRCSHFCFPAPSSSRVCGCPYGMKLQENQRDCVKDDSEPPIDTSCGDYSFPCDGGRCMPDSYRCDGVKDCMDQTDEANCTDTGGGTRIHV